MSYEIHGLAYDTRDSALTALVAAFVSGDGLHTLDAIRDDLNNRGDLAEELVKSWGGGKHELGLPIPDDEVFMGKGEAPADAEEIDWHVLTHKADIIMASTPNDCK